MLCVSLRGNISLLGNILGCFVNFPRLPVGRKLLFAASAIVLDLINIIIMFWAGTLFYFDRRNNNEKENRDTKTAKYPRPTACYYQALITRITLQFQNSYIAEILI